MNIWVLFMFDFRGITMLVLNLGFGGITKIVLNFMKLKALFKY